MNELSFTVSPRSGVAIYRQIVEQVRALVAGGRLAEGDFLPGVRGVAESLEVNPMTVSKAYSILEREGVVEMVRGKGLRVRGLNGQADKYAVLLPVAQQLVETARRLAMSRQQVLATIRPLLEELDREPG